MSTKLREIEWHETYELGFAALDEDHRRLVDTVNRIIAALRDAQFEECVRLTTRFVDILNEHFPREEQFLTEIAYPHLKEHADNHLRLLTRAEEFGRLCQHETDAEVLTEHFAKIVRYMLADMRGGDLDFRTHLVEKGINKVVP